MSKHLGGCSTDLASSGRQHKTLARLAQSRVDDDRKRAEPVLEALYDEALHRIQSMRPELVSTVQDGEPLIVEDEVDSREPPATINGTRHKAKCLLYVKTQARIAARKDQGLHEKADWEVMAHGKHMGARSKDAEVSGNYVTNPAAKTRQELVQRRAAECRAELAAQEKHQQVSSKHAGMRTTAREDVQEQRIAKRDKAVADYHQQMSTAKPPRASKITTQTELKEQRRE